MELPPIVKNCLRFRAERGHSLVDSFQDRVKRALGADLDVRFRVVEQRVPGALALIGPKIYGKIRQVLVERLQVVGPRFFVGERAQPRQPVQKEEGGQARASPGHDDVDLGEGGL